MAFCTHCGTKLGDNAKFCSGCGAQTGGMAEADGTARQTAPVQPPSYSEPEEETVLFPPKLSSIQYDGLISVDGKVDGHVSVTTKRIIFTATVVRTFASNFDVDKPVEIPIREIHTITKRKYMFVFPKVSVTVKEGKTYSFLMMTNSSGDALINAIEKAMGSR